MLAAVQGRVGGGRGKNRYKLLGPGRPEEGRGPKYIAYISIFGCSVLAEGAEKLFHGAPNPLSATLTRRHIETYQIYFVTVFRLSSAQTRILLSPPNNPQSY